MTEQQIREPELPKREWVAPEVKTISPGSAEAGGGGPEQDSSMFVS